MNKIFYIILIAAVVILAVLYALERNSNLSIKDKKLVEEKKVLFTEIDSLEFDLISLKKKYNLLTDSLRKEELNIKYRPYEKIKYIDRTLDNAVVIIDSSKYLD